MVRAHDYAKAPFITRLPLFLVSPAHRYPTSAGTPIIEMPALAGTKRKGADDGESAPHPVDLDSIEIPAGTKLDSCNVVRGKINRFIESGGMKVGEFCDALSVSGNGYRRFLALNGKDAGSQSDTYIAAWEFFQKRELAGIKPPKKQKTSAPRSTSDSVPKIYLQGKPHDS